jgi:hypothetical protein
MNFVGAFRETLLQWCCMFENHTCIQQRPDANKGFTSIKVGSRTAILDKSSKAIDLELYFSY